MNRYNYDGNLRIRLLKGIERLGITHRAFAQRIGIKDSTLSGYCSGKNIPNAEILARIANALNVSADDLLGIKPTSNDYKTYLDPGAFLPLRAHEDDAGLDLFAKEDTVVPAHGTALFDTGVHIAIPHGMKGQITSKSGLCTKHDITSEAGTIDSGYRGSIRVKLRNDSDKPYIFKRGDKIAQLVISPVYLGTCKPCENLSDLGETERGTGAFGSTGK